MVSSKPTDVVPKIFCCACWDLGMVRLTVLKSWGGMQFDANRFNLWLLKSYGSRCLTFCNVPLLILLASFLGVVLATWNFSTAIKDYLNICQGDGDLIGEFFWQMDFSMVELIF